MKDNRQLPRQLAEVAAESQSLSDFGHLLREWNHTLTRADISNRPALGDAIRQPPRLLANEFAQGEVADAYLGAYAEWIADQAGIHRPQWTSDSNRSLAQPWFADNARASLLVHAPASFRQRNLFTVPEEVVCLRRGRPRVGQTQKKAKARERDRRYRQRMQALIQIGRKHATAGDLKEANTK